MTPHKLNVLSAATAIPIYSGHFSLYKGDQFLGVNLWALCLFGANNTLIGVTSLVT